MKSITVKHVTFLPLGEGWDGGLRIGRLSMEDNMTGLYLRAMSHYLQSYLIKADDFRKLYGARNAAALRKINDMLADELDDLDEEFNEEISEKRNAAAVLADIMNAELRFPEIPHVYARVFEKLCARFGKQFFPPNDEYSVDYWNSVDKGDDKPFIPLPKPAEFPQLYSIHVADLEAEKERFLNPATPGKSKNFNEEREDFEALFNKAIAEKKDIQFFLY